jgi:hypothetical protein
MFRAIITAVFAVALAGLVTATAGAVPIPVPPIVQPTPTPTPLPHASQKPTPKAVNGLLTTPMPTPFYPPPLNVRFTDYPNNHAYLLLSWDYPYPQFVHPDPKRLGPLGFYLDTVYTPPASPFHCCSTLLYKTDPVTGKVLGCVRVQAVQQQYYMGEQWATDDRGQQYSAFPRLTGEWSKSACPMMEGVRPTPTPTLRPPPPTIAPL